MDSCCRYCVAPKRYPGCHGACEEYKEFRAEYDKLKAEHDRARDISVGIYDSRSKKVYNAMRYRRNKKV